VLLGEYDSPQSRQEYARVLAEWEANDRTPPATSASANDITIAEVILAYWRHVETYYRHPDQTPTSEADNIRLALRPVRELYGHSRAADFDAIALEAVRDAMSAGGRCRSRVNRDVSRVKRMFR
jgi:hypothetical protein